MRSASSSGRAPLRLVNLLRTAPFFPSPRRPLQNAPLPQTCGRLLIPLLGERVRVRGLPGNRPWQLLWERVGVRVFRATRSPRVTQRSPVGEGWGEGLPGNHPRVPQRSLRIGVFCGRWRRFIPIPQKQDRHNPPRRLTETLYLFPPQRPSPFMVSLPHAVRIRSGVGAASQTRPSFRWASRSRWRANVSRADREVGEDDRRVLQRWPTGHPRRHGKPSSGSTNALGQATPLL